MGVREWLDKNRRTMVGIVAALVIIAIGSVVYQVLANRPKFPSGSPDAYFTVDDGKSYFPESSDNIPPFDYKGQPAVRACVYECGGKRFVGYMERYTPEARKTLLEKKQSTPQLETYGREVKRPGSTSWIKASDTASGKIIDVRCPDGSGKLADPVEP
jgi:hypothetical protein